MSRGPDTRASLLLRIRNPRDERAWAEFQAASLRLTSAAAIWRRWRWPALLAIGLAVLVGALLIAVPRVFLTDRDAAGQPLNEPGAATTASQEQADAAGGGQAQQPSTAAEELHWQDGVEARLRAIEQDLYRLEDSLELRDSVKQGAVP